MVHGFCFALGLYAIFSSRKYYMKAFPDSMSTLILPILLDFFGTALAIISVVGYYTHIG